MIELKHICKSYKQHRKKYDVLKDINLTFPNYGLVSILGPSGCGKTTLLNLIGGLDKATSGDLIINGISTSKYTLRDWDNYRNNYIGFVFQNFNLLEDRTVYNNVELTLRLGRVKRKERKEKIRKALEEVGLLELENKKVKYLSGGEKQRVVIARAIINNPEVVLADEPTGSLDSATSTEIMNILKEISKDRLVIMVSHNIDLVNDYSDDIIHLNDGIIDDKIDIQAEQIEPKKIKKVHMSFLMALELSFKNMYSKIVRTLATILAGSIGIIAVTMVLGVTNGVGSYIEYVQGSALNDYPIVISSNTVASSSGNIITGRKEFPDNDEITVTKTVTNYEAISKIDKDFLEYIGNLDSSKYTILNYNRSIRLKLVSKLQDGTYKLLFNPSYFTEIVDDYAFMESQYDVLAGKLPTEYNEISLVIDKYNSISYSILQSMGLDNTEEKYKFEDIIGKEYKFVDNNQYYRYVEESDRFVSNGGISNYEKFYNESDTTIKIVGIIREKKNCDYGLYSPGMIYSSALTNYVLERNLNSDIVKRQLEYGYSKDVTTGKPYEEIVNDTSTMSIEYQYESDLVYYGAEALVVRLNIYSMSFDNRLYINDYIKSYEKYKELTNINYIDRMTRITQELSAFVKVLTKVLLILALISLLVSIIMIAIINYISVMERIKEIGLLRSVGARRIDILQIFSTEAIIIGLFAGIIGILLSYALKKPINGFVQNVLIDYLEYSTGASTYDMIVYVPKILIMIALGSALLTFISCLLPSIIGSIKKPIDALRSE